MVLTQLMLDDHNKVITLTLCIWLVFWYDFQGLEATFLGHLQVGNENLKKKKKNHDFYGLTIVCVKFNNWKLTTSLFLFFYEDSATLC